MVVRLGVPVVDDYLEFLEGRCRPNTVLAAAYDLRVFFELVAKPAEEVEPADVHQRPQHQHPTFIDGWTDRSHPFVWTMTAEQIRRTRRPGRDRGPRR